MNTLVNITMHVSFIRTGHQLPTGTFPSVPRCTTSEMNNYHLPNRKTEICSGKPRNIKIATLNYLTLLMPAVTFHIAVFCDMTLLHWLSSSNPCCELRIPLSLLWSIHSVLFLICWYQRFRAIINLKFHGFQQSDVAPHDANLTTTYDNSRYWNLQIERKSAVWE